MSEVEKSAEETYAVTETYDKDVAPKVTEKGEYEYDSGTVKPYFGALLIDPKDIYIDIYELPDPIKIGITVQCFNYDDVGLYFRVKGLCTGWTFTSTDLGLISSGGNVYRNLDEFGTRAKPSGEMIETIAVILEAYTDAGYTNLKWTVSEELFVNFIKSDDGSWSTDFLNNFNDGTVQGWAVEDELGNMYSVTIGVATDFVLSPPYSLRATYRSRPSAVYVEFRGRIKKSFITPNKTKVYAILNVRVRKVTATPYRWIYVKYCRTMRDTTVLVFLGRPYDTALADYFPLDKWMRIVVPLPANTTILVSVGVDYLDYGLTYPYDQYVYEYLDDFQIISK